MHVIPAAPTEQPVEHPRPEVDSVAKRSPHSEPLSQGLHVVQQLLDAHAAVLFSILPTGLVYHAALGDGSARLAAALGGVSASLHVSVQGPIVLSDATAMADDLEGATWGEAPIPGAIVFADRRHRDLAQALALSRPSGADAFGSAKLRFAQSIFRDLVRYLSDHAKTPDPQRFVAARWERFQFAGLVGGSKHMRTLFATIEKLAASDVNVLVLGESGTGKELVARAIHDGKLYAGRKFVAQNCAALPEALLESELFGHCKGAFTGANFEKRGLFEEANGGSFFLDEIADMPVALQIKMLRVLQDGEIRRLGETRTRRVSVRIIAATNKLLSNEVAHGRFRQDLYHRLNVVKIELPPLRRRREDIPLLARFFCDKVSARLVRRPLELADSVLQRFADYEWPGNVRELENEIERLVALYGNEDEVQPYMLSERLRYGSSIDWSLDKLDEIHDLHRATEYLERVLIARSLERHVWNKSRAASELGISRQGLIKKVRRLRLVRPGKAAPAPAETELAATPGQQLELPFWDTDAEVEEGDDVEDDEVLESPVALCAD